MKVELLVRDYGRMIGLARYTVSLLAELQRSGVDVQPICPSLPWPIRSAHALLSPFGLDLESFLTTYPVRASFSRPALKHLTAQQMASLLWLDPTLHPSVVTVHDIIPFLVRDDRQQSTFRHPLDRLFDQLAMSGLRKAEALISDSYYTKSTIAETLNYPERRIFVVHLGVVHDLFRPMPVPKAFLQCYGFDRQARYLLYVGSDNPRKNLPRLIQAFAQVHQAHSEVRLIKVGTSENPAYARLHREAVARRGLAPFVHWLDQVPEEDLPLFYNLARVFVFPSFYEGFGLPPLEAMACGTPVVCSRATSLPEVVGDAALLVDPLDVEGMAAAIQKILCDADMAAQLRQRGLEHAARFTWERTARETLAVYEQVFNGSI